MKRLAALRHVDVAKLEGVLFDLDDTVLTHGRLEREAYDALWSLADAGLKLVAVTGRPAGWGEVLARQWPVDGVVVENGACAVVREGRGVDVLDPVPASERDRRRMRLGALVSDARRLVPSLGLADDVGGRRTDVTWDIGERVRANETDVVQLLGLAREAGARTTRSSVHVHATFDGHDKASGAVAFLGARFGTDPSQALVRWAFVGDSGNDAPCFAAFDATFGVANVRSAFGLLGRTPRWVSSGERGEGFAEIAARILAARDTERPS